MAPGNFSAPAWVRVLEFPRMRAWAPAGRCCTHTHVFDVPDTRQGCSPTPNNPCGATAPLFVPGFLAGFSFLQSLRLYQQIEGCPALIPRRCRDFATWKIQLQVNFSPWMLGVLFPPPGGASAALLGCFWDVVSQGSCCKPPPQ